MYNTTEFVRREKEMLDKLYTDMYTGDGKENPSVTTRLDRLEQQMSGIVQLKWALIGAIIMMGANIISAHIH